MDSELKILSDFVGKDETEVLKIIEQRHHQLKQNWSDLNNADDMNKFYSTTDFYLYDLYASHTTEKGSSVYNTALWDDKIVKRIVNSGAHSVLDYGCGCGYITTALAKAGIEHVVGIDIPGKTLDFCKYRVERLGLNCEIIELKGDYKDILKSRKFDVVVLLDVVEHLPSWKFGMDLLKYMHKISTDVYANITWGKQFGVHPMHLDAPSDKIKSKFKALYKEAYE